MFLIILQSILILRDRKKGKVLLELEFGIMPYKKLQVKLLKLNESPAFFYIPCCFIALFLLNSLWKALGIKKSEESLAKLLKTTKSRGTYNTNFNNAATVFCLDNFTKKNASIIDL